MISNEKMEEYWMRYKLEGGEGTLDAGLDCSSRMASNKRIASTLLKYNRRQTIMVL